MIHISEGLGERNMCDKTGRGNVRHPTTRSHGGRDNRTETSEISYIHAEKLLQREVLCSTENDHLRERDYALSRQQKSQIRTPSTPGNNNTEPNNEKMKKTSSFDSGHHKTPFNCLKAQEGPNSRSNESWVAPVRRRQLESEKLLQHLQPPEKSSGTEIFDENECTSLPKPRLDLNVIDAGDKRKPSMRMRGSFASDHAIVEDIDSFLVCDMISNCEPDANGSSDEEDDYSNIFFFETDVWNDENDKHNNWQSQRKNPLDSPEVNSLNQENDKYAETAGINSTNANDRGKCIREEFQRKQDNFISGALENMNDSTTEVSSLSDFISSEEKSIYAGQAPGQTKELPDQLDPGRKVENKILAEPVLLKEEIKGIDMVSKESTAIRTGDTAPNLPSAKPEFENIERAVVGEPKSSPAISAAIMHPLQKNNTKINSFNGSLEQHNSASHQNPPMQKETGARSVSENINNFDISAPRKSRSIIPRNETKISCNGVNAPKSSAQSIEVDKRRSINDFDLDGPHKSRSTRPTPRPVDISASSIAKLPSFGSAASIRSRKAKSRKNSSSDNSIKPRNAEWSSRHSVDTIGHTSRRGSATSSISEISNDETNDLVSRHTSTDSLSSGSVLKKIPKFNPANSNRRHHPIGRLNDDIDSESQITRQRPSDTSSISQSMHSFDFSRGPAHKSKHNRRHVDYSGHSIHSADISTAGRTSHSVPNRRHGPAARRSSINHISSHTDIDGFSSSHNSTAGRSNSLDSVACRVNESSSSSTLGGAKTYPYGQGSRDNFSNTSHSMRQASGLMPSNFHSASGHQAVPHSKSASRRSTISHMSTQASNTVVSKISSVSSNTKSSYRRSTMPDQESRQSVSDQSLYGSSNQNNMRFNPSIQDMNSSSQGRYSTTESTARRSSIPPMSTQRAGVPFTESSSFGLTTSHHSISTRPSAMKGNASRNQPNAKHSLVAKGIIGNLKIQNEVTDSQRRLCNEMVTYDTDDTTVLGRSIASRRGGSKASSSGLHSKTIYAKETNGTNTKYDYTPSKASVAKIRIGMEDWLEQCREPSAIRNVMKKRSQNRSQNRKRPSTHEYLKHNKVLNDIVKAEYDQVDLEEKLRLKGKHFLDHGSHQGFDEVSSMAKASRLMKSMNKEFKRQSSRIYGKSKQTRRNSKEDNVDLAKSEKHFSSHRTFPKGIMRVVCLLPGNDRCCDCARRFRDFSQLWASPTYGTMLCEQCSFVHINNCEKTKVEEVLKPMENGNWTFPTILSMLEGGNYKMIKFMSEHDKSFTKLRAERRGTDATADNGNAFAKLYNSKAAASYRKHLAQQLAGVISNISK